MKRQAAFTDERPLLKGALHCHTTRSDGRGTPEQVIQKHIEHGYDFLAITDHRLYNFQNFVPGSDLLIVPGMEIDRNIFQKGGVHCFHSVVLGRAKQSGNPFEQDQTFDSGQVADQFEYQAVLDEMHAAGQMTIYCHPQWSGTSADEFDRLRGNFAMEIWNSGCAMENGMDTNAAYWDNLLMQNQSIFGVAVDDGHQMRHHGLGWVMVNARERTIDSVLEALAAGAFYSSCGPEIVDFYVEEGEAVIACSPCQQIEFYHAHFPTRLIKAGGAPLTEGRLKLPEFFKYARAAVVDEQGRRAWTNPIFLT